MRPGWKQILKMTTMRAYRAKNKFIWLSVVFGCGFLIFLFKRYNGRNFYDDNYSIRLASDDDSSTVSTILWPPKLRIVKKQFAVASNATGSRTVIEQKQRKSFRQACRFPELRVDDPDISHLFHDVAPLKCAGEKNWIYVRNGTFYIDPDAERRHGGDETVNAITCDYMNFWRETDFKTESKVERNFRNGTRLRDDFFKVDCRSPIDGATYSNVHAAIVASPEVIDRCRAKKPPKSALGLNVYMLGFDSISRMTFMRKLPKTYKYLTKVMGAVVLQGYNIVGDGTPQALIPILTGKTEVELPLTRKRFRNAQYVNVYPFVWNEFREAGYATLYGEDAADVGTFTYRLKGFNKQPTDHYMRTFYTVAEGEQKRHPKYCWGSEPHHKAHFGYVEHFWETYPSDIRKFAFQFHSILSHNDINQIGVADDDMVDHLKLFVERGYMNDTLLIFMADHGHRFANLRETQQGKLEERLPFFSFAFPPWFAEKYPKVTKAFRANAQRLTTPFDIHATLKSILDFRSEPKTSDSGNRELSLFDYVPPERSCADAAIEPHWCSCLEWTATSVDEPLVQYMARALVHAINLETERERRLCSKLRLASIDKASRYAPSSAVLRYKEARDKDGFVPDLTANTPVHVEHYQLNIRTTPGDAHYEASMNYDHRLNEVAVDLDVVSHVNKFGDSPHCIIDRDYFLAKWCVCYDKVEKDEMVDATT